VLFCDVTGSTKLGESTDPEALRALLARYFERMKGIVESHGGAVEKFIGDAVMAVFGVPQVHEDDALRACRAAVEMRDALPELGVQARIGVNTGEVVTGTEERLATGDAVNVAARLEQSARAGEILIGKATHDLAREAVEVDDIEALELKGKAEPVQAYRLLEVTGELARRHDVPMVGRRRELTRLRAAYDQAVHDRACQLFTVLGAAGVGKSRLAYECLDGLNACVVRGRCLSYGEGITYWPVVEVLKQLDTLPSDQAAAVSLRSLLGETDEGTTADEIAWAFRKLLEQRAQEKPLVCVFDDIHWAEATFLDLVEHVADLSRDAPLLVFCMARPELLDKRPGWGGGKLNATTVLLEPLSTEETDELLDSLGGADRRLRDKIRAAAEGNPLFVEEMLALVQEADDDEIATPPTIQALLAARLDQLDSSERSVLERGAVEGRVFHRGAVQALAPDEPELSQRLISLVRKELVRPDRPQIPGDDAFRFRHLLIRDAAYDALPKATRAALHERFAAWLGEHGVGLVELDEILGYHLEQAALYRAELGAADDELAARAAEHLLAAGRRALLRDDHAGAVGLLSRSGHLLRPGTRDEILIELAMPLAVGGYFDQMRSVVDELQSSSQPRARAYGMVFEVDLWRSVDPPRVVADGEAAAAEAEAIFSNLGDERGLALVAQARFDVQWMQSRSRPAHAGVLAMREHALRSGDPVLIRRSIVRGHGVLMFGDIPVEDVLDELERTADVAEESLEVRVMVLVVKGYALGLQGRFEEGRELQAESDRLLAELGNRLMHAANAHGWSSIALLSGDTLGAVEELRRSVRELEELGERGFRSTSLAHLAVALHAAGEPDEAKQAAFAAEEISAPDDFINFALSRSARALVLADRGELEEAEELARSAVDYAFRTDFPLTRADALAALARVLRRADRETEAEEVVARAVALYEGKGAGACVRRVFELADVSP
jgi:class 3 adenylate cyclase/tetratricopeptide (TPR) repeat protein